MTIETLTRLAQFACRKEQEAWAKFTEAKRLRKQAVAALESANKPHHLKGTK